MTYDQVLDELMGSFAPSIDPREHILLDLLLCGAQQKMSSLGRDEAIKRHVEALELLMERYKAPWGVSTIPSRLSDLRAALGRCRACGAELEHGSCPDCGP